MAAPAMSDGGWDLYLRSLSTASRDSPDPAYDQSLLHSVTRLHEICKAEKSESLIARVYPQIIKLFQRLVAAIPQSRACNGILFLAILQFFLDFGEMVLHDADPSLRAFFRSCLSREFADLAVAEATLNFLSLNKEKMLSSFPSLLPQFFPLLLKLIAWNGEKVEHEFLKVFPGLISPGSFLPLFPSLIDLPVLVVALEKVEKNSGSLLGSGIASLQKSTAPEMLLALMDEAYTGSSIEDRGGDSGSDDKNTIDVADPLFLDLLKDENDGLAERHATYPGIAAVVQATVSGPISDRLKQALRLGPRFLDAYFAIALQNMNDSLICALLPLLMTRVSTLFPDRLHTFEVQRRLLEFMLAAFQRSPNFVALLKKPIIDRLGEAYDSPAKTELALQLCWAIGEHGGGGTIHENAARELFESLELLLYENLSSSRLGISKESNANPDDAATQKSSQARLLSFVLTAISKLATCHRELLPRARVSLAKVARSQNTDRRVWRRACDYLGLMNDPAICMSILGPISEDQPSPGVVNWSEGGHRMISHIPFYILQQMEGPPFHDFSISDIIQRETINPLGISDLGISDNNFH